MQLIYKFIKYIFSYYSHHNSLYNSWYDSFMLYDSISTLQTRWIAVSVELVVMCKMAAGQAAIYADYIKMARVKVIDRDKEGATSLVAINSLKKLCNRWC